MCGQRHIHKLNMAAESHLSCSYSGILTAFMSIFFDGCKQLNGSKSSRRVLVGCDHMRRFVEHTCIFYCLFWMFGHHRQGGDVTWIRGHRARQKPWNMSRMTDIYGVEVFSVGPDF